MNQRLLVLLFFLVLQLNALAGGGYFKFDAVSHYKHNISELEAEELDPDKEPILYKILGDFYPKTTKVKGFEQEMVHSGYIRTKLQKSDFPALREIFSAKKDRDIEAEGCIVVYRDILVFKFKGKITGIVKICFWCSNVIVLRGKKILEFGSVVELRAVGKILYPK